MCFLLAECYGATEKEDCNHESLHGASLWLDKFNTCEDRCVEAGARSFARWKRGLWSASVRNSSPESSGFCRLGKTHVSCRACVGSVVYRPFHERRQDLHMGPAGQSKS